MGAGGYVGLFGPRGKAQIWISGFVNAQQFQSARQRLEALYELVNGRRPTRVTKTDVVEYALLATEPGSAAFDRLRAVKNGKAGRGGAGPPVAVVRRRGNGDRRKRSTGPV